MASEEQEETEGPVMASPDAFVYKGQELSPDDKKSIVHVVVDSTLVVIPETAFKECFLLTSIVIPEGIKRIGDKAFSGCESLSSIDIPVGLESIGVHAFFGCQSLTSINIPKSVTTICDFAFCKCSSLKSIAIPEGVETIPEGAFFRCEELSSIHIPKGVKSIGRGAFAGCYWLSSIGIPKGVTSIGKRAFKGCESLTSIYIPSGVKEIGSGAFSGCLQLLVVAIPKGTKDIDSSTFEGCKKLRRFSISHETPDEIEGDNATVRTEGDASTVRNIADRLHLRFKDLPLHLACYRANGQNIEALTASLPKEDARKTDMYNLTPLHILAGNPNASERMIRNVVEKCPDAVTRIDNALGMSPLHFASINPGNNVVKIISNMMENKAPETGKLSCTLRSKDLKTPTILSILHNYENEEAQRLLYKCQPCSESQFAERSHKNRVNSLEQWYVNECIPSLTSENLQVSPQTQNGWVYFVSNVSNPDSINSICKFFEHCPEQLLKDLRSAKDDEGKEAIDVAVHGIKAAFNKRLYFLGRYEIIGGPAIHKSEVCIVIGAIDMDCDGMSLNSDEDRKVAIKFVKDEKQFLTEISFREDLQKNSGKVEKGEQAVISINESYNATENEEFKSAMQSLPIPGSNEDEKMFDHFKYAIVMPFADRNLDTIARSEQLDPMTIRSDLHQIAKKLQILHQCNTIHCNLKMQNIVRRGENLFLTDFDGSAKVKHGNAETELAKFFVGKKFSSGILPPEMVYNFKNSEELNQFEAYYKHLDAKSLKWKGIKHQTPRATNDYYCLKTFDTEMKEGNPDIDTGKVDAVESVKEGLPYDPVVATEAIDLWSLGTILYFLCTKRSLFRVDTNDNLADGDAMEQLYYWNDETKMKRVNSKDIIDPGAKKILLKLLSREPGDRGTLEELLNEPFFGKLSAEEVMEEIQNAKENAVEDTKVIINATNAADEAQTFVCPTTFVVLKEKLPPYDSDQMIANRCKEMCELVGAVGDMTEAADAIPKQEPDALFETMKGKLKDVVTDDSKTMYFYLVDELTGKPVTGGKYPIEITNPAEVVPTLLPYIKVGMTSMAVYDGTAGVLGLFGLSAPQVSTKTQSKLGKSIDILKQKSSNATEGDDDASSGARGESLRGESLRQLEGFFKSEDPEQNYAGLHRILDREGIACWTAVHGLEKELLLEKRQSSRRIVRMAEEHQLEIEEWRENQIQEAKNQEKELEEQYKRHELEIEKCQQEHEDEKQKHELEMEERENEIQEMRTREKKLEEEMRTMEKKLEDEKIEYEMEMIKRESKIQELTMKEKKLEDKKKELEFELQKQEQNLKDEKKEHELEMRKRDLEVQEMKVHEMKLENEKKDLELEMLKQEKKYEDEKKALQDQIRQLSEQDSSRWCAPRSKTS
ncbi:unnamed protein product [Pseudo-nitzschia multistriata]|uniref:Protein kinase domain-containing protein n=1 Tax=Pseudo-nitzschia multistriata TaxID=183589 RepID=A0A448Z944_9STRA|nr:unnamed protein product [Pseudo-nitzschia multistriata]